ncbi:unnamed protein product [Rotaria magnacalcarata]|uniref:MPN domain-containing protein n=6 Tax=Rotaria magnacalcarata TaxID=392030 RepID=A0A816KJE8_9BILA|nr:unnamed protein product [Rotaria magnacalcarata]CAF1643319.1 unnamed protein product [Rotaria magnacalcarata]CAF1927256.1 unnamed protein product [Rotaria magnacalcarata]CAF1981631.1 unnamed protein product [Rotaria magnacalcarata]CAF1992138.1 unnamed protein product [Rotaria magnacalcarata]
MSEINTLAFVKMFLHLAKYPELAVNGVLLSTRTDSTKDEVDSASYLNFVDCIPLFHGVLSLSPMLEIALSQIDAYCSTRNLTIAGYYHANENYSDTNPNLTTGKIMEKIRENNPNAALIMIDNTLVDLDDGSRFYNVFLWNDKAWKNINDSHIVGDESRLYALSLLKRNQHRQLVDFDNHLDSISNDWRNPHIQNELQSISF